MFRRVATLACAAFAGAALVGLSSGTAAAQSACPDVHWIGAAGSGERTPAEVAQNDGMGRVVYQSLQELSAQVQQDGRTMTAEAVEYPAVEAPGEDGGVGEWLGFIGSVDAGAAALGKQYEGFVQRCPATKVVLAGYSQGAMVVHRNLQALEASPNLAAVLLVADGDRLPEDPTLNLGTASGIPERGKGAAQDWPILAHAPGPMSPAIGARTISVCDLGDAVCDYNPDDEESSVSYARGVAIHTSYASTSGLDWTAPLYFLLGGPDAQAPAPQVPEAQPIVPLSASAPTP
ncbi:cutinase family protein [Mycolicibacterium gadium]|uniref:Cutinase family protein n=1 Tax=Mycolicibacterium gadium TaxID=1794 RepID=A0ABT6GJ86_MYCGU|nr:cutinase family protein [Mycolicibacterium gadium]MDG5481419.1 cutinase family protein [Mycolicibacterium gadium]